METIVLVHGLWMRGPDMGLLKWRLQRHGYNVVQFSYDTVGCDLQENARRLNAFVAVLTAPTIHFVCHSLGGLVVRRLFHDFPEQPPGRVVTLGSPHTGSYVARRLSRNGWLRRLFGRALPALDGDVPPWRGERELGSLAGDLAFGPGHWLFRDLPDPNDGTVAVEETRLEGMHDHKCVTATHLGLLLLPSVCDEVLNFLREGCFRPD